MPSQPIARRVQPMSPDLAIILRCVHIVPRGRQQVQPSAVTATVRRALESGAEETAENAIGRGRACAGRDSHRCPARLSAMAIATPWARSGPPERHGPPDRWSRRSGEGDGSAPAWQECQGLADHLVHVVVAVGCQPARRRSRPACVGELLVLAEKLGILRSRNGIIRIAVRRRDTRRSGWSSRARWPVRCLYSVTRV